MKTLLLPSFLLSFTHAYPTQPHEFQKRDLDGFMNGLADGADAFATGIVGVASDPVQATQNVGFAITHPGETVRAAGKQLQQGCEDQSACAGKFTFMAASMIAGAGAGMAAGAVGASAAVANGVQAAAAIPTVAKISDFSQFAQNDDPPSNPANQPSMKNSQLGVQESSGKEQQQVQDDAFFANSPFRG